MKASFLGKMLDRVEKLGLEDLRSFLKELARDRGFLETIFNTLQEGVVVLDQKARILYLNRACRRLLSIPEDAEAGQPIGRYLKEVDWKGLLKQGQAVTKNLEITYPETRFLQFYFLPVEGREDTFVGIFHDITKERTATKEAIESERVNALTMLAAGVAHELGNPLNSLNIHLQLMERDLRDLPKEKTEVLRESIDVARGEIHRLDTIINQFLKAVRPTVPEMGLVNPVGLLGETLQLLTAELKDRNILLEKEIPQTLPDMQMDREQIKQAFFNVIKNAMQAVTENGIIRIEAEATEDWVTFSFTDNGAGISVEDLPHVLEPYFTTKSRGTGLGLMIVQRIISEHGGQLGLESDKGKGTTVRIRLPLRMKKVRLLEG